MKVYWPRRHPGLPPGQRRLSSMPRFSDDPLKPPPPMPDTPSLEIAIEGKPFASLGSDDLNLLGPGDHKANFHCVTTWSMTGLTWTGVSLAAVLASVGIHEAPAPYARVRAGDRRSAYFLWDDLVADDVILATHLNGETLGARHGGPLRLVAPQQYAYKSVKHLVNMDFSDEAPRKLGKEHLRARVALEERHPRLPGRLLRVPYRLLVPPTAYLAERSLNRHRS